MKDEEFDQTSKVIRYWEWGISLNWLSSFLSTVGILRTRPPWKRAKRSLSRVWLRRESMSLSKAQLAYVWPSWAFLNHPRKLHVSHYKEIGGLLLVTKSLCGAQHSQTVGGWPGFSEEFVRIKKKCQWDFDTFSPFYQHNLASLDDTRALWDSGYFA